MWSSILNPPINQGKSTTTKTIHKPNVIAAALVGALELAGCSTVALTAARIRELSPILRDLEGAGKIQVVGCIYDLYTALVRFLPRDGR
jgi:carbonic anhydrase